MYIKELTEKKNDLITRAEEVLDKAKQESRELTEDEAAELAEIRDNVERIKKTLEAKGFFDGEEMTDDGEKDAEAEQRAIDDEKLFEQYIRGAINEREANMTVTDNGAVIPTTIADRIIKKIYDISPILERSSKYNIKGKLQIPYYDESTQAITVAWATEFQPLTSNIGKTTNIELDGYLAGALSLISRSLINNSKFDIVGFVVDHMAYAIHRFIENALLNGSGSVTGLSTATNGVTAAAQAAVTADEVIQLKDSVKDAFQNNAIFIMSPATRTALRLLKDDVGRYLLQDDITSPFGSTLLGKPIYVSDNMPDMAAGARAIYYGDMTGLATKFSEDINIQVLREKYADQHAIGVVGWLEFDSKIEDAQKVAVLKMHA